MPASVICLSVGEPAENHQQRPLRGTHAAPNGGEWRRFSCSHPGKTLQHFIAKNLCKSRCHRLGRARHVADRLHLTQRVVAKYLECWRNRIWIVERADVEDHWPGALLDSSAIDEPHSGQKCRRIEPPERHALSSETSHLHPPLIRTSPRCLRASRPQLPRHPVVVHWMLAGV